MEAITVTEVKAGVITATQPMEAILHITEEPLMAVTTPNMEDTLIGVMIKEEVMRRSGTGTKLMEANLTTLTMVDTIQHIIMDQRNHITATTLMVLMDILITEVRAIMEVITSRVMGK